MFSEKNKRRAGLLVVAALGGSILASFGGVLPAQAQTDNINGTLPTTNSVVQYWNIRTPGRNHQATQRATGGTLGGSLIIGFRNSASGLQYARAQSSGQTVSFKLDNGSVTLPSSSFYLNVKSTGACGGSCGGGFPWSAVLAWNL